MARPWTILSTHGIVLMCVARDRGMRLRDIADCVGVAERTAFGAVSDLVEADYLRRYKDGTRNRYEVNPEAPFRHPTMADHWIGELLAVLLPGRLARPREQGDAQAASDLQGRRVAAEDRRSTPRPLPGSQGRRRDDALDAQLAEARKALRAVEARLAEVEAGRGG